MSAITKIQWTDRTWNPVRGCSIVSPGCISCYAMKMAHRFSGAGKPYDGLTKQTKAGPQWTGKIRTIEKALLEPLSWRKPARIFVNSMSDLFHEGVPDEFIDLVFAVMALAPRHTFQILTKRAERMRDYMAAAVDRVRLEWLVTEASTRQRLELKAFPGWPLPNVWLGVSAEDQQRADERIPLLLQTPAAVRFISAEPLLGPIDLRPDWLMYDSAECPACQEVACDCGAIDWVIVGGESGPGARPCVEGWIRSIVGECALTGVSCFVKQMGSRPQLDGPCSGLAGYTYTVTAASGGVDIVLKDSKGGNPSEWPADLRVREFPRAEIAA